MIDTERVRWQSEYQDQHRANVRLRKELDAALSKLAIAERAP